ncbi:MAG: DUF4249 domain-containing protein [Bacteroidota bacterium]
MKSYYINICLFLIAIFVFTSCEERIDIKLKDSDKRIVVEGSITTETKAHKVIITESSSYFYNQVAPVVSGATVTISDNLGNVFPLTEIPSNSGIYYTDANVKGIAGRTYTLKITNVDIDKNGKTEEYTASDLLKPVLTLDTISFELIDSIKYPPIYAINGWGQEPSTTGDYYVWKYYKNGILESDTLDELAFSDDNMVNGNYLPGFTIFAGAALPGDTITVETISATKGYFDFIISFMIETRWNQGGIGGPPANVKTNISNGGLGWFNASDVTIAKGVVPN